MSTHDPGKPGDYEDPGYESRINALLEGELTPAEAEALKAEARDDPRLAQAIVEAWQLQESLDGLAIEKAPDSLSRRLLGIPLEYGEREARTGFGLPGWALSLGVVVVAVVALNLVLSPQNSPPAAGGQPVAGEPSSGTAIGTDTAMPEGADPARVAEARRELAIAFHYIDKAGLRAEREIRSVLNEELAAPVKDNLTKHIPYMPQASKEKQA